MKTIKFVPIKCTYILDYIIYLYILIFGLICVKLQILFCKLVILLVNMREIRILDDFFAHRYV
jgi:hypothetical protein